VNAKPAVGEKPRVEALGASREEKRGQQQERRGRQQREEDPDDSQCDAEHPACSQKKTRDSSHLARTIAGRKTGRAAVVRLVRLASCQSLRDAVTVGRIRLAEVLDHSLLDRFRRVPE